MKTYTFNFDADNLEIFPSEIWQDPKIVFHGTSEYHSEQIERDGFIPATSPYQINDAKELVRVLQLPEIQPFDIPGTFGMTVSRTLNSYIFGIENDDFRLSFAYLSGLCVYFAIGKSKGGQSLGSIRNAKSVLEQACQANPEIAKHITEPIKRLFQFESEIMKTNGVVYAIRLEEPFNGITEEYGNIHSSESIPLDRIVGKVIIPNTFSIDEFPLHLAKQKNQQKLIKPNGLGIILNRINLDENEE